MGPAGVQPIYFPVMVNVKALHRMASQSNEILNKKSVTLIAIACRFSFATLIAVIFLVSYKLNCVSPAINVLLDSLNITHWQ